MTTLPAFKKIQPKKIVPELKQLLDKNRSELKNILKQHDFTWENLMLPLENMSDAIHHLWAPVHHLTSVVNTDALRKANNEGQPLLSDYDSEVSQNVTLFHAIQSLEKIQNTFTIAQKKVLENDIRDFKLSGVHLSAGKKAKFAALKKELTQLQTKFEENVLDSTQAWTLLITNKKELAGLPESALASAKQAAEKQKKKGWLFTLEIPSYLSVMQHADSRALRKKMYEAYNTRASDQSPSKKKFDNAKVMANILKKRQELAHLLDFKNFAELSLATKMAKTTDEVLPFLNHLLDQAKAKAIAELESLKKFAKKTDNIADLKAWDVAYYSEKLRTRDYNISQEELRAYFPAPTVINGLFEITHRLFQINIKPIELDRWHPDVKTYAIYDSKNNLISYFYLDLYTRENKRGGAWMDDAVSRRKLSDGSVQIPAAYMVCNFTAPIGKEPSLLTHDEVETLFHEFGHALQHMLTTVDYLGVSGISGIPWDAVEVASQFYENWTWQQESLKFISKHYQTGKPLPDALFQRLKRSKHFQSAMQLVRQIEFSLFDFILHMEFDEKNSSAEQVYAILNRIRKKTQILRAPKYQRFPNSFSHIFGGGYAAGYYSYKWAEVMAADAFEYFLERGIFNAELAKSWRENILEPGGSVDPAVLFQRFRGHAPDVKALLRQSGIIK